MGVWGEKREVIRRFVRHICVAKTEFQHRIFLESFLPTHSIQESTSHFWFQKAIRGESFLIYHREAGSTHKNN
jgi:hypothetical protein